jgi:spermidine/putrescine transport system substrate-binding protein
MKTTIKLTLGFLLAGSAMAQADSVIQVYNWGGYTSPELLAKFEAETGIRVVVTDYDSSDTALARVRQGGHGFDVAIVSSSALPVWVAEGLMQPLDSGIVTDRANIAAEWQNVSFDPGREYTVPWAYGSTGIMVNTNVFGGDINTADVIFNPPAELVGRINVVPEMSDVMALAIYHAGGDDACTTDLEILRNVRDTLMAAKRSWAAIDYGSSDSYVSGDLDAGIRWNGASLNVRIRAPQFAFGYPVTGYPLWMDNAGVLTEAANRDAAMRFVNFLLQPENAAMNSVYTRYANGIAGSEAYMDPVMVSAPEIVPPAELAIVGRFTPTCSQDANDLHSRIWAELLQ